MKCPVCGRDLTSEAQKQFRYCSSKCRDAGLEEERNKKSAASEAAELLRQYEEQRKP